ncbi:TlpA family protein disulfide reductase [Thalassococcus lentus]|uniref:TlpA disulfide reductase family protein n=1 Tax=Thalassococcus lentus TaxID=1210524 RepID=A0ABT4XNK8_9RHOB|nr:TlpA disulfide reductase family protein [Thalassococcus lentus]MDA7423510.1 TlpA disulfide reductase family protein [Thalassococcus lentus]
MKFKPLLYTAAAIGAIAAAVTFGLQDTPEQTSTVDTSAAQALLEGSMKKLIFHPAPKPAGTADFTTFDGDPLNLSQWQGKWTVVNFWATWCAPCRKEMPMLAELQTEYGGETFEVVTIATTRNPPQAMQAFFEEINVTNLPLHRDPGSALAREMAVLGLPVTVILNPDGQEIARLSGDADWASASAKAMIEALLASN